MSSTASDAMPCRTFLQLYTEALQLVNSLIDIPRKILRKLQNILLYPMNRVRQLVSDAISSATSLVNSFDLGITDFLKSLRKLISCPLIADSALGKQAATLLDSVLTGTSISSYINQIVSLANTALNATIGKLENIINNSASMLLKQYKALLDACGLTSALKTLGQLQTCIADLCTAWMAAENMGEKVYGFVTDTIPNAWEKLCCWWNSDEGVVTVGVKYWNNTVKPLVSSETEAYEKEVSEQLEKMRTTVTQFGTDSATFANNLATAAKTYTKSS